MNRSWRYASDDSVQVLLDGKEIWINSVDRWIALRGEVDEKTQTIPLDAGAHLLVVKVFSDCGEHHLRLRFQDPTGAPLTEKDGLKVCLDPEECGF